MQDQIYQLKDEIDKLRQEFYELRDNLPPALRSFRNRVVQKDRGKMAGLNASSLAESWLKKQGFEWNTHDELSKHLWENPAIRKKLYKYLESRASECTSSSITEALNFLRSF